MAVPSVSSPQTHSQTAVQTAEARQTVATQKKQPPASDTVKISSAAKQLQQQSEAAPQTIAAASAGDVQAKAQLAKPNAAPVTK